MNSGMLSNIAKSSRLRSLSLPETTHNQASDWNLPVRFTV